MAPQMFRSLFDAGQEGQRGKQGQTDGRKARLNIEERKRRDGRTVRRIDDGLIETERKGGTLWTVSGGIGRMERRRKRGRWRLSEGWREGRKDEEAGGRREREAE